MYPTQNFEIFHLQWVPGPNSFKHISLFQNTFILWDFLGVKHGDKSEMFELGQNSSKFGNFDTNRCAPGVGPQKCWFWQFFAICLGVKTHSSFFGSFLAPRIPRLGPY